MSYNGSDQSDGEGFIPNKMIIKQRQATDMKEESSFLQFEPRYLTGEIAIKKQPPQSYQSSHVIQRYLHDTNAGNQIEVQGALPNASSVYLSENYECVYSRFKRPFGEGEKASFSNEIIIKTLARSEHFRTLKNWRSDCIPSQQQSKKLKFDSKFQSGNLLCAFRSLFQIDTYVLFMQNDTNTNGYNQWFYFSILEAQPNKKYTFKIANFKKKYSFFKYGVQPYIFSLEESKLNKCGWFMDGSNFQYYRSNFSENPLDHYYTLEFQLAFKHPHDFVMICPTLPYGYSKLIQQLNSYKVVAQSKGVCFDFQSVSKTLGGNEVPYLKISKQAKRQGKKIIVITARQHSGEIWSSHLMDEIIQGIVKQDDLFYQWILDNFDFHIFPMINVDGVIYGNFRCDLAGYDLNRCWKEPSLLLQPHIYRIKQKIQKLADSSNIQFYFDLHTHSKEHGAFAYSCVESTQGRRLPLLISSLTPLFRYPACTFGISLDKRTTARSSMFDLTNNMNTITIQLSAFGYRHPKSQRIQPFTLNNIKAIAQSLVNGIYYYDTKEYPIIKVESFLQQSIYPLGMGVIDCSFDEGVSGSDSQPDVDEIAQSIKMQKIFKQLKIHQESKINKTKTRVKKLKANINLNNSTEINEINEISSLRNSPVNRVRAMTETKEKRQIMQTSIVDCKSLLAEAMDPKKTVQSFKKTLKATKLGPSTSFDQTQSTLKVQLTRPPKPLNLIQFSLKKLPIFSSDKLSQFQRNDHSLISSISLTKKIVDQQKLTKNKIITFYRTKKQKEAISQSSESSTKEPYQFLCVMSQSKKKQQILKIKQRRQQQQDIKLVTRMRFKEIKQSTVLQRYLREKKIQNAQILSKVWMNNFNRYSKSLQDPKD